MGRKRLLEHAALEFVPPSVVIAALHTAISLPILVPFMLVLPLSEYEGFFTSKHAGLSLLGIWRLIAGLLALYVGCEALLRHAYDARASRRWMLLSGIGVAAMLGHLWMYSAVGEASFRWRASYRVPLSIRNLDSQDPQLRSNAVSELGGYGARSREAVPGLIKALEDPSWSMRSTAAYSLGLIGPDARIALPKLLKLSREDSDSRVHTSAKLAIELIRR